MMKEEEEEEQKEKAKKRAKDTYIRLEIRLLVSSVIVQALVALACRLDSTWL